MNDQHLVLKAVEESLMVHPAHVGMVVQPFFVDAVDEIVAVVLGEAELHAEDHVHAQTLALFFGQMIPVEIPAHALLPVVVAVHNIDIGIVQMVRDAEALVPEAVIGPHLIRGPNVAAAAGLHGVQMQLVFIHGSLLTCPKRGRIYAQ